MNYIIFDLEWNQPTEEATAIREPFYLPGEIIEIGAAKLDEHFHVIDLHGIDISSLPDWYDLQRIFGREIMRGTVKYSLEYAMEVLGESGDAAHDAMNDSVNTAKICDHLDLEEYLDEYASRVFAELPNNRSFDSQQTVLQDPELLRFSCPWCGKAVACEGWIHDWKQNYVSYGQDEDGDKFYVTLSVSRLCDGTFRAKRIFQEMSDDLWEQYQDKKEALEV